MEKMWSSLLVQQLSDCFYLKLLLKLVKNCLLTPNIVIHSENSIQLKQQHSNTSLQKMRITLLVQQLSDCFYSRRPIRIKDTTTLNCEVYSTVVYRVAFKAFLIACQFTSHLFSELH